jgi:hypothetical protein
VNQHKLNHARALRLVGRDLRGARKPGSFHDPRPLIDGIWVMDIQVTHSTHGP